MHADLADHIALIAAPIYAALLMHRSGEQTAQELEQLRNAAVYQAMMLRRLALETPAS